MLIAGVLCGVAFRTAADSASGITEDLKLLPPYRELPPTFWQQHGSTIIIASVATVLVAVILLWLFLRQRPAPILPPEVQARRALEDLLNCPESGDALSNISQVVRRYLIAAFQLPPGETTTTEFSGIIANDERVGSELSSAVVEFLRQCDERKFAPQPAHETSKSSGTNSVAIITKMPPLPDLVPMRDDAIAEASQPLDAASRALELIALGEARRAQLRQPATA